MVPKNIAPEFIGKVRSGRRSASGVRELYSIDPYEGLGKAVSGAFAKVAELGDKLEAKREEADYLNALNSAEEEINRRMQDEVFSKTGMGSEGAYQRADVIFTEVSGKYSDGLSAYNKKRYTERLGRSRVAGLQRAYAFESSEINKASRQNCVNSIERGLGEYASGGNDQVFSEAQNDVRELYKLQNGGRAFTMSNYREFEKDISDGDGKFTTPDGKMYRITDDDTGEPGTLSKAKLETLKANMLAKAEAYENFEVSVMDKFHAARVDRLLDNGDISAAEQYLASHSAAAGGVKSGSVFAQARRKITAAKQVYQVNNASKKIMASVVAQPADSSFSGDWGVATRYGSPVIEDRYIKVLRNIKNDYPGEEGERISRSVSEHYKLLRQQQQNNVKMDVSNFIDKNEKMGKSYSAMLDEIANEPESPYKEAASSILKRRIKSAEADANHDIEYQKKSTILLATLNNADWDSGDPVITLDGVSYQLYKKEDAEKFLINAGFTRSDRNKAAKIITSSKAGSNVGLEVVSEIRQQVRSTYGKTVNDKEAVMLHFGGIIAAVSDSVLSDDKFKDDPAKRKDEIKKLVAQAIVNQGAKERIASVGTLDDGLPTELSYTESEIRTIGQLLFPKEPEKIFRYTGKRNDRWFGEDTFTFKPLSAKREMYTDPDVFGEINGGN